MTALAGKVAWITGAAGGIGEAAALALAGAGATVVLTGRRTGPLEALAARIRAQGGEPLVAAGDVAVAPTVNGIAARIAGWKGRLDILVNNAGTNVRERRWHELTAGSIDTVLGTNLSAPFYCSAAAIQMMRPRKDGVLMHVSSWAGHFPNNIAGSSYTASKAAVIAMSHTINMEESANGIRSTVIIPAEVETPILNTRALPPTQAEREKMLRPSDLAELILFIATRPATVCLNEVVISPAPNRLFTL
jgi:NADP-dependent 3-hydroxy acid dehydrogenase YdfG